MLPNPYHALRRRGSGCNLLTVTLPDNGTLLDLRSRPRPLTHCGVCGAAFGSRLKATRDHVVPKGFFRPDPPKNLPTWLVCRPCQEDLEPREDRLRTLFAAVESHHPEEISHAVAVAARSTRQPVLTERRTITSIHGETVRAAIVFPHQADLDAVFTKIARGLFWRRHGLVTADPRFVVRLLSAPDHTAWTMKMMGEPVQKLGAQFWWKTRSDAVDRSHAVWLFLIYGAVGVGVWHGRATDEPDLPRPFAVAIRDT